MDALAGSRDRAIADAIKLFFIIHSPVTNKLER